MFGRAIGSRLGSSRCFAFGCDRLGIINHRHVSLAPSFPRRRFTSNDSPIAGATGDEGQWDDEGIPKVIKHYNLMGEQYRNNGMYDQADRIYQKAIDELEQFAASGEAKDIILAQLLHNRGVAACERGRYDQAEDLIRSAISQKQSLNSSVGETSFASSLGQLGLVLYHQREDEASTSTLLDAKRFFQFTLDDMMEERAIIEDGLRNDDDDDDDGGGGGDEAVFEADGDIDDEITSSLKNRGRFAVALLHLDEREAQVRLGLAGAENTLGLVCFRSGAFAQAAAHFSSAIAHCVPTKVDPVMEMNHAACLERLEEYDAALETYKRLRSDARNHMEEVGPSTKLRARMEQLQRCIARTKKRRAEGV